MTLYEIDAQLQVLLDQAAAEAEENNGEISETLDEQIEALSWERETKLHHIGLAIKNIRAEASAIEAEEKSLKNRREQKERIVKRLERLARGFVCPGEKYAWPEVEYSWRQSTETMVSNVELLPDELVKVEKEPRKKAIKEALVRGEKVPGCWLEKKQNLQIR